MNVWIFQANPSRYNIATSLRVEEEEYWNLRQHAATVSLGDTVLIWISGGKAGIYAVGEVISAPEIRADSEIGIGYWSDKREGRRPIARVLVRYKQLMLDRPLGKAYLEAVPQLWNMRILRSPRGTNFPVRPEEWTIIERWLSAPDRDA